MNKIVTSVGDDDGVPLDRHSIRFEDILKFVFSRSLKRLAMSL